MSSTADADTVDGTSPTSANGYVTLRSAVNYANVATADTIIVPAGAYILVDGQLEIARSIVIRGAVAGSTTIGGNGTDRVFTIAPADSGSAVKLSCLTIANGHASSGDGGGLRVLGGAVQLDSVDVIGNTADNDGGGIYTAPGTNPLVINNSTVMSNRSGYRGGGIYGGGPLLMRGCVVAYDSSAYGGGIALMAAPDTLCDVTVRHNYGPGGMFGGGGGGVYLDAPGAFFADVHVDSNLSRLSGGGVVDISGGLFWWSGSLWGNRATGAYGSIPGDFLFYGSVADDTLVSVATTGAITVSGSCQVVLIDMANATTATNVTSSTATLNGTVRPFGLGTSVYFLWGTSPGVYTDSTAATPATVDGDTVVPVSTDIAGLSPEHADYFTVAATNARGCFRAVEKGFIIGDPLWGNALGFDGNTGQYAHHGSALAAGADTATLEAWVKWSGAGGSPCQTIVSNGNAASDGYGLYLFTDSHIALLLCGIAWFESDSVLPIGEWVHLAAVRNGNDWSVYENGKNILSCTGTPVAPGADFYVGGQEGAYPYLYSGLIDEVRFSDSARYASDFTPPAAPFAADASTVALYHFDEGSGSVAHDASGNNNDLALTNGPNWTYDDNPLAVEAGDFLATAETARSRFPGGRVRN